jgi:hypothetical protein
MQEKKFEAKHLKLETVIDEASAQSVVKLETESSISCSDMESTSDREISEIYKTDS